MTLHLGTSPYIKGGGEVSERSEKGCLNFWVKIEKICKLSLSNFLIQRI